MLHVRVAVLASFAALLLSIPAGGITIQFDYTYDTKDFFGLHPEAVDALNAAGEVLNYFSDDLEAILPSGTNSWTAVLTNPGGGGIRRVSDLNVPADTVIIYVGGQALSGSTLAWGGPGGWTARGTAEWLDTVSYRGQTGAAAVPATDFGPWGGSVCFDSDRDWHFGIDTPPSGPQPDFLSVATHELAHVLGFGISDSWDDGIVGLEFVGTFSTGVYGGNVPLDGGLAHWAQDTFSTVGGVEQEAAMSPAIYLGARKWFTILDHAGMIDVGWNPPGPGDANADGLVTGADYTIWADNYLLTGLPPVSEGGVFFGNFNEDDAVTGSDYTIWADYYTPGQEVAAPLPAPEPGAAFLLMTGAVLTFRRRIKSHD